MGCPRSLRNDPMPDVQSPHARPGAETAAADTIDLPTRLIHLALAVLGVAALVSGQFAGDYRRSEHPGFTIHSWLGIGMSVALSLRILWGILGPRATRFVEWVPVTRMRFALVWRDLAELARFDIPKRATHEGLAGLVQAIGLLAFVWMAVTGVILFVWLEPGARATGWLRLIKELHEGGQVAAFAYLALHVGAVVVHAFTGHNVWRRMFFLARRGEQR
jgi:cytochrome b